MPVLIGTKKGLRHRGVGGSFPSIVVVAVVHAKGATWEGGRAEPFRTPPRTPTPSHTERTPWHTSEPLSEDRRALSGPVRPLTLAHLCFFFTGTIRSERMTREASSNADKKEFTVNRAKVQKTVDTANELMKTAGWELGESVTVADGMLNLLITEPNLRLSGAATDGHTRSDTDLVPLLSGPHSTTDLVPLLSGPHSTTDLVPRMAKQEIHRFPLSAQGSAHL
jgi:hypothetical protein